MTEFKKYRRKQISELRPIIQDDIDSFNKNCNVLEIGISKISISDSDLINGSPKIGDMIARNPANHNDKWLVSKQYFIKNFEEI